MSLNSQTRGSHIVAGNHAAYDCRKQRHYSRFRRHRTCTIYPLMSPPKLISLANEIVAILQESYVGSGIVTSTVPSPISSPSRSLLPTASTMSSSTEISSFFVHASHLVPGQAHDVVIRPRLDLNPKWSEPLKHLLKPFSVVQFTGVMQRPERYTCPNTTNTRTRAVALDDITYHQRNIAVHILSKKRQLIRKTKGRVQ